MVIKHSKFKRWSVVAVYWTFMTFEFLSIAAWRPLEVGALSVVINPNTGNSIGGMLHHILAYALLILLIGWANRGAKEVTTFYWFMVAATHAMATECLQLLVPGRRYNLDDLLCNFLGVFLGVLLVRVLYRDFLSRPASSLRHS